VRVLLEGVAGADDQFGVHTVDMGAGVLDHAVIPRQAEVTSDSRGARAPQVLLGLQPRLQASLSHPKAENGTADALLRGTPFSMLLHAGNHGAAIRQAMAEGHRGISRTRLGPKGEGTPRSLERANLPLASFHVRRPL
jgi:hypothetical protein